MASLRTDPWDMPLSADSARRIWDATSLRYESVSQREEQRRREVERLREEISREQQRLMFERPHYPAPEKGLLTSEAQHAVSKKLEAEQVAAVRNKVLVLCPP